MANQVPNKNLKPSEAQLSDLIDLVKNELKLEFNCMHVGTIQEFNKEQQTAKATINYKRTYLEPDTVAGIGYKQILRDYPILAECPVVALGGGAGALTFPIQQNDECLILFNDRDIDNWFAGSSNSAPATPRLHSFSDGFILVGVRSLANVIADYDDDAVALRYGDTSVKIYEDKVDINVGENVQLEIDSSGKVKITNSQGEFVQAISTLFTDIQNATTNTIFGPQPLIMPTFAADLAVFDSFKN